MIRRNWMVVDHLGRETVFVYESRARAEQYAQDHHGHVVLMMGRDHLPSTSNTIDVDAEISKDDDRPLTPLIPIN